MVSLTTRAAARSSGPRHALLGRGDRWQQGVRLARIAVLVLLGVLATQAVLVVAAAQGARSQLEQFRADLEGGDTTGARSSLQGAERRLGLARAVRATPPLALGSLLPGPATVLRHTDQLLAAAQGVSRSGGDLLALAELSTGSDSRLFDDGRFDLPSLHQAADLSRKAGEEVARAQQLVEAVQPAWYEPGLGRVVRGQSAELREAGARLASATAVLDALPSAVGESGPRRYVVTVLNPAELRFSGGAALSLAQVEFTGGRMEITRQGSTFELTNENETITWPALPGDAWVVPGPDGRVSSRLVNATFSPDWRTAGEQLLRAYEAQFGEQLDGVLALDPRAMAGVLAATGPAEVEGYGTLTAGNLVDRLLVDAYGDYSVDERRALNDAAFGVLLDRLTSGRGLLGTVSALTAAAEGRHVLAFFRDPLVAAEVAKTPLSGALPEGADDFLGVYTQNTNASKVDVFQERAIEQRVQLRRDGGADVVRTVTISNATPAYEGPDADPGRGYLTRVSRPVVALYLPAQATHVELSIDGREARPELRTDGARTAVSTLLQLPSEATARLVLTYRLPRLSGPDGTAYSVDVASQPMVRDPRFRLEVVSAAGTSLARGRQKWAVTGTLDHDQRFSVQSG